jgi:hypothetical protein
VFHAGTVETTYRAALAMTWQPVPGASAELSGGMHYVRNAGHSLGESATRAVGTVAVRYMFQFGGQIGPR